MQKLLLACILGATMASNGMSQTAKVPTEEPVFNRKYSIGTTYLSLLNFEEEKTNTHHYELHLGCRLTAKDKIGIKVATWKMFAPMGMPMLEQLKFDERNFYPGRLRETGIGVAYQRMLWKGLFAAVEIMPQLKNYLDENNKNIGNGFKLYTSYHLGYHVSLFKNRIYLEPQIHCQYWPVNTNVPRVFKELDDKWNNYILFEPDIYLGVRF
jgi:hypothetical protein